MSLTTATPFQSNPSTFTLVGDTRGGPPTTYVWTKNDEVITRNGEVVGNGPYNVSIRVDQANRENAGYASILVVTGDLPGIYEYIVSNRAMTSNVTGTFGVQGNL